MLDRKTAAREVMYGINTDIGELAEVSIEPGGEEIGARRDQADDARAALREALDRRKLTPPLVPKEATQTEAKATEMVPINWTAR